MEVVELVASKRSVVGKAVKALRQNGLVPAVVYGHEAKSEPLEISARDMERVYAQAGGNKIVALKVGSGKARNVLIHEVQTGGLRGELTHVDFYVVRMDEALSADVPLRFVGESDAVFKEDGVLVKLMESVEIECLPADLPESIEVDISVLDSFDKTITLAQLELPKGVKLAQDDLAQLVAKVEPPRTEAEMAELEASVGEALPEGAAEDQPAAGEQTAGDADRHEKK